MPLLSHLHTLPLYVTKPTGSTNLLYICIYTPLIAQLFSGHLMDDKTSSDNNLQSYTSWIRVWMAHLSGISDVIWVPPEATANTTPLNTAEWEKSLVKHPNRALVNFYIFGISQGF